MPFHQTIKRSKNQVGVLGYLGVFALMTLESACIPIPSEAIMLFAGFSAFGIDSPAPLHGRGAARHLRLGRHEA